MLPNRSVNCELLKLVLLTPSDGIRFLKEHVGLLKKAKDNSLSRTCLRKSATKTVGRGKKADGPVLYFKTRPLLVLEILQTAF